MKIHALAAGVVFSALTTISFAQSNRAATSRFVDSLGRADQSAITHFNVYLPLTRQDVLDKLLSDQTNPSSPSYHHWLTPAQFKAQFGPSTSDVAKVRSALESSGFTIVSEKTQSLEVSGPVSAVENTFGTHLNLVRTENSSPKFAAESHLTLPASLASVGATIPEFKTLSGVHVHSKRAARPLVSKDPHFRLSSSDSLFYPNDLKQAYRFPSFLTEAVPFGSSKPAQIAGVGSTIGIVISSAISPDDLDATFDSSLDLGGGDFLNQAYSHVSNLPVPTVSIRPVEGGSGPFDPTSDAAAEASLDTQMSLGTAPGAQELLYNPPDLGDDSLLAAYADVDEDNAVDVVSSSFGECELYYTAAYNGGIDYTGILNAYHALFQQGNAQGITFVASSGDNGALDCLSAAFANNPTNGTSFVPGVEWPAADPNVTAVGGTNLTTTATPGVNDARYKTENANFDPLLPAEFQIGPTTIVTVHKNTWGSGGGYSHIFSKPSYQNLVSTGSDKYRSVPDVSLMMGGCPEGANLNVQNCLELPRSATIVWLGGEPVLLIGTSSSAPEVAGVLALAVELNGGRLGNVNPLIYLLSAEQTLAGGTRAPETLQIFHRVATGNNNFYKVKPEQAYSEVLGNGTLDVTNFLGLYFSRPATAPNDRSNP
jgi:subtilase family serine protease